MGLCAQLYEMEITNFTHKQGYIHVRAQTWQQHVYGSMCICASDRSNKCQKNRMCVNQDGCNLANIYLAVGPRYT